MSRTLILASALLTSMSVGCSNNDDSDSDGVQLGQARVTLAPPVAGRGQSLTVKLRADRSRFNFGTTELDLGQDILVHEVTVADGYLAEASISIDPDAELGLRDAVVTIDGVAMSLADAFRVTPDSILAVEPNSGKMGEVLDVAILGSGTDWQAGYTWGGFGSGINVMEFAVLSPTLATAKLAIRTDARPGLRDVTVETGPDVVALYEGFTVDRAVIACEFEPGVAYQGETRDFTISCADTDWGPGTRVEFWDDGGRNPDIAISELQIINGENMYGRMRLSNAAFVGMRDVFITNGTESVLLPDALSVLDAPPRLDNVAISLGFDVRRQISNTNGTLFEQVSAFAAFVIPLDPPCGVAPPPGDGPMPYDINGVFPIPPQPEPFDCPAPQTVSAGDYVWFESDENIVTLEKDIIAATGQVIYVGRQLTLDDYRFNKLYDLVTQGDPDGIPAITLERVQPTVPADYYILSPDMWGDYTHSRSEPFNYTWTPAQTYPDAIFVTQISGTLVATGEGGFAGSIPWDDGDHTYVPAELSQLEPSPVTFVAVSYIEGPYFGFPFSTIQSNQSDSVLSTQARLILE
jgi:hypothetical protein